MRDRAAVHSLVLLLAAIVAVGCAAPDVPPDPLPTLAEPSVWLPDDGLPVPPSVANRRPLRWCGLAVVEGDRRVGDQLQSSRCVLTALAARQAAEMVVHAPNPRTGQSILFIVRVASTGEADVVIRSTAPGLPPLWELERCTGAMDQRVGAELGGRLFEDLLLANCGPSIDIVD